MMSWNGNNYFAPESFLTKDKRRVMLAWLMNLPLSPTGVQSLPRELELPKDGVLRIAPLRELETLRYDKNGEQQIAVKANSTFAIEGVSSDAYELELKIDAPAAKEFGVDVLCDKDGNAGMRIGVNAESKTLQVGTVNAPFELAEGEDLELRVFIDKNLVEVFANGRQAALSALETFTAKNVYARLFTVGSDLQVDKVTTWKMKTIYDGNLAFADD
jgi:beta-fructofuranosidase